MKKNKSTRLLTVISNILDVPLKKITLATPFERIDNWDSMNHIKLILAVEEEFDIKFTDAQIGNVSKPLDLLNYIEKKHRKN